jgi:hypothetical protein
VKYVPDPSLGEKNGLWFGMRLNIAVSVVKEIKSNRCWQELIMEAKQQEQR